MNTRVAITGVRAGSAVVDTTMQFLVAGDDSDPATAFQSTLQTNLDAVLPPATWGQATLQGGVASSEVVVTLPQEELTVLPAPDDDDSQTGLIVGLAVGRELGRGGVGVGSERQQRRGTAACCS